MSIFIQIGINLKGYLASLPVLEALQKVKGDKSPLKLEEI